MAPQLRRIGNCASPVVIVDRATGEREALVGIAAAMAPFPESSGTYYPGLRRIISPTDRAASDYVDRLLVSVAPFVGGGFGATRLDLLEASFSMVTTPPARLSAPQRAPHFDSTDPNYLAILHYLGGSPGSGTAFYRQRSTGFEEITPANVGAFVRAARRESAAMNGYIDSENPFFEQIEAIEAVPDRLLIYRGNLLHSGIIPPGTTLAADPRTGRLTANLFVRIRQE